MKVFADIAVIGGGASGLAAAITAKRENPSLAVCVFEALDRVGKKLITTGNGRCNISNKQVGLDRYHGEQTDFARFALETYGKEVTEDFFESVGLPFTAEGDKLYPASLQASSVVDCLRFECDRLGVETVCGFKIDGIEAKTPYLLRSGTNTVTARSVIVAAGLFSGGDRLGCDGGLYRLLKSMGHTGVKVTPAIVQLKTETDTVKQLKGIKTDATATLLKDGKPLRREFGEVLFCDYGLSGPAVMQISREALRQKGEYAVSLDLYPDAGEQELCALLQYRASLLNDRLLGDFFTGMMNKRLGQVVLKYAGMSLSDPATVLGVKETAQIARTLKDFRFRVTGNTGFCNSQVSAGGLATAGFSPYTMMSKKYDGLFACGEILDIDGDCGGFNLQWAWSSGMLAAKSAVKWLEGKIK